MGVMRIGQTLQLIQNMKITTLQWLSESAREEDEAPLSVRRAQVSHVLRSWFIFDPAPRKMNVSETPCSKTHPDRKR